MIPQHQPRPFRRQVAWGRDRDAAARVLAEACERGEVSKGDRAICAVWPHGDDLPPFRWATDDQISNKEMDAILDTLMAGLDAAPASPPSNQRPAQLRLRNIRCQ